MPIRHTDRRRLARLAGPRLRDEREAIKQRVALRRQFSFHARIALTLAAEGVDPESTCIADRYREAKAALDAIPDTPELAKADDAYLARCDTCRIDNGQPAPRHQPSPRDAKTFEGKIERLMNRLRTDCQINFANASPIELYTWCLSRQQGESYEEAAAAAQEAARNLLKKLRGELDEATPTESDRADLSDETQ